MHYFGTDGIRGIPNDSLSMDLVKKLGYAIAICFDNSKIVIAHDSRSNRKGIINALKAGISIVRSNMYMANMASTPELLFFTKLARCVGIMITASHNNANYNGIKLFFNGKKVKDNQLLEIEKVIELINFEIQDRNIPISEIDIEKNYLKHLEKLVTKSKLTIALDCANGSLSYLSTKVFKRISKIVYYNSVDPNGENINEFCGTEHIDNLQALVLEKKCDIGFAFDGDGDRISVVDANGAVYKGEAILFLLALEFKRRHALKNNSIVTTEIVNQGLVDSLLRKDINTIITGVGDSNVLKKMQDDNIVLGGEPSGHIIFDRENPTSDGLLTALKILKILKKRKKKMSELLCGLDLYYTKKVNISCDKDVDIEELQKLIPEVNPIDGRIILRKSGTEDVLRVIASGRAREKVDEIATELVLNIYKAIGCEVN